jgi:hypothetical protein
VGSGFSVGSLGSRVSPGPATCLLGLVSQPAATNNRTGVERTNLATMEGKKKPAKKDVPSALYAEGQTVCEAVDDGRNLDGHRTITYRKNQGTGRWVSQFMGGPNHTAEPWERW